MINYNQLRQYMVNTQIRPCVKVVPKLIQALSFVPREIFVDEKQKSIAYLDDDLLVGPQKNRVLMRPFIFCKLIQSLCIKQNDRVLDIGCGTGYSATILSYLADEVFGIDDQPDLLSQAKKNINNLEISNVTFHKSLPINGFPEKAQYDGILINGAVENIPSKLFDQLAEGGRLVTILKISSKNSHGVLFKKCQGRVSKQKLFEASTLELPCFMNQESFYL